MNPISLFRSTDPYEMLIQQMLSLEGQPKDRLKEEKAKTDKLKLIMKDVDSKMSALRTLMKKFTDPISSPFDVKSASLSNTDAFEVSAGANSAFGTHTLEVLRMASSDTRLSKQFTSSDSTLKTFFDSNGAQNFSIEVAHPIEGDETNRVSINVSVNPTGTTDGEILDEIRTAIKTAMDDAVAAGTIKKEEAAVASAVNETSTTSRLTLLSGKTGYANRLSFTDSAGGLLAALEINSNVVASGTGGGQAKAVGTGDTDSELNSKFILDGLTLYRSSNSVSDALTDVTLKLKQAGLGAKEFTVKADSSAIRTQVDDFIKKFNDIMVHLQAKTNVDKDAGTRGDLAGDSTFRSLRYELRNDVIGQVTGQPADAPAYITDLGIKVQPDGTLKLEEPDKLIAAVEKDADAVESLFGGANGIATRLQERVDRFVGVNGIISDRQKSLDDKLKRINSRISDWDDKLSRRETQLRMQFARLQESIATLQGQSMNFSMFTQGGF